MEGTMSHSSESPECFPDYQNCQPHLQMMIDGNARGYEEEVEVD